MVNYLQNKEKKLGVDLTKKDPFDPTKLILLISNLALTIASAHVVYYVWSIL